METNKPDLSLCRDELGKLLEQYFLGLDNAVKGGQKKVAWCSSIGPSELLVALGFQVFYPENHGAMLGASRMAADLIPRAVAEGYSPEICSYLTSDIGAYLENKTPLEKKFGIKSIPRPDVIVFNNNQCREVSDWFAFYARRFKVPLVGVQSPRVLPQVCKPHLDDVHAQLNDCAAILEDMAGRRLDRDYLAEVVGLSKQCTLLWKEVLLAARYVPSPMTFFDHCIFMAPAVVLRGLPEAVGFYKKLLSAIENEAAHKKTAVRREKRRIYWDGMPVWGRMRMLSQHLEGLGAAVVASSYCNSWLFEPLDSNDPLRSMAKASLECFNVRDEEFKLQYILNWLDLVGAEAVIFHDAKTCPYNTNSRFGLPKRMQNDHGVPVLVLDGDLNDLRCFSDEQALTNIEAFVEQLGNSDNV